jgi:glutamate-1-semialdehyde 2,1-aminomutase
MRRRQHFSAEVTRRGAFFHPHHNWFISAAHSPADVEATLHMADEAFAVLRGENL